MADISGRYDFHRDSSSPGMQIVRVDGTGRILEGQIGQAPITGQYNASDNSVSFNDARQPGDTLYATFYTGSVMMNADGSVYGMAGTYQELTLIFIGPIPIKGVRAAERPAGTASSIANASATAVATKVPQVEVTTVHGAWFALRLDEPLV